MGLFDIFSDVAEIVGDVADVVLAPVEVVTKGAKAATGVAAELAKDIKDTMINP